MVKVVNGNLLHAKEDIIAHQVNCRGVMGAGLARQIKNSFPHAYQQYQRLCESYKENPSKLLGACQLVHEYREDYHVIIANLFGQDGYGYAGTHTDEPALREAFRSLAAKINTASVLSGTPTKSVAMPWGIGCGLGGGHWPRVYEIIEQEFAGIEVVLYKLK